MSIKEGLKLKNPERIVSKITEFIKEEVKNFNREGIILGLSGGIDSALGAYLSVKAVGRDKLLALFLPERDSHPQSKKDAELIGKKLGIRLKEINISPILKTIGVYKLAPSPLFIPRKFQERYVLNKYRQFQTKEETTFLRGLKGGEGIEELKKGIAFHRIKHRVRMILWYYYGELNNYLIVGNCNRTEKLTGYFVKYGDSGSDIDPVAPLFKTQVKQLAKFLDIPQRIINKAPSPDLMPGMTDEYALQMTYEKIDQILYGLVNNIQAEEIIKEAQTNEKEIDYVKKLMYWSKHMRSSPPQPNLSNF